MTDQYAEDPASPSGGIGARLRAAREARGLTIEQLAAETRIPQRHLQTIEAGDFAALPARTYAVGFSKTYARAVGLDENEVSAEVRDELDAQEPPSRYRPAGFEPGDPARVPSGGLVWVVVAALALLLVGGFFFMRTLFAPAAELPSLVEQQEAEQAAAAARQRQTDAGASGAEAAVSGPVVFTAIEEVWVRFYTPSGTLMEALMAPGDTYTVPQDADRPMIRTGRPDALRITIGGREVPRLAEEEQVMSDVPVTPEALRARPRTPAPVTPSPSPTT
jgi:transcriptional regulator with XRE-family HTH domain